MTERFPRHRDTLLRATVWLAFLGPFFFLTYNFANAMASHRAVVPSLMFSWERYIPFLPWTILPYWSSDLLYAASLFVCTTRDELDRQGKRLLAIQIVATACFLAFPLRCAFVRPPVDGWEGSLFSALLQFDRPFNQAPSLHVGLAVILWARFRRHTTGLIRVLTLAWLVLICISALTTYQHQFIDVPTGAWLGLLVVAAFPERRTAAPQIRLTFCYLVPAIAFTAVAFALRGWTWLLLWPAFALSMVAASYWTGDPAWLGTRRGISTLFLLPYTAGAWINSRMWTRGEPSSSHLADGVWIGRAPSSAERREIKSIVGLAPELHMQADAHVAMLDLVAPDADQLEQAVCAIAALAEYRPTLVCCALGYSRSAVASAAWLMSTGRAATSRDALQQVSLARPQIVAGAASLRSLEQWAERRKVHAN